MRLDGRFMNYLLDLAQTLLVLLDHHFLIAWGWLLEGIYKIILSQGYIRECQVVELQTSVALVRALRRGNRLEFVCNYWVNSGQVYGGLILSFEVVQILYLIWLLVQDDTALWIFSSQNLLVFKFFIIWKNALRPLMVSPWCQRIGEILYWFIASQDRIVPSSKFVWGEGQLTWLWISIKIFHLRTAFYFYHGWVF